jgi:hypothetical protein
MPAKKSNELTKVFLARAKEMVDVTQLTKMLEYKMGTNIEEGDHVVSSVAYDGSIFVIDPRYDEKNDEFLPAAYEERVEDSRDRQVSVKVGTGRGTRRMEWRIKATKLNLLGWDEKHNTFPRQSDPIIFRQMMIDPVQDYALNLEYYRGVVADTRFPRKFRDEAVGYIATLELLAGHPPFLCYHNFKYGVLFKTELDIRPIVLVRKTPERLQAGHLGGAAIQANLAEVKARHEALHGADLPLAEALAMAAFHPDRVERMEETHGEGWFDAHD